MFAKRNKMCGAIVKSEVDENKSSEMVKKEESSGAIVRKDDKNLVTRQDLCAALSPHCTYVQVGGRGCAP